MTYPRDENGRTDFSKIEGFVSTEHPAWIPTGHSGVSLTLRKTSEFLEREMGCQPVRMLDHGFIFITDYMATEESIVNAARMSYQRGTRKYSDDVALLRYLMRHQHWTPFEMCEIAFHVKLPIFVARQWIRHRTANVNETSARYSVLDKEFYIPDIENIKPQSTNNKQGRAGELTREQALQVQELLKWDASRSYNDYEILLGKKENCFWSSPLSAMGKRCPDDLLYSDQDFGGIARELARMNLTLNTYTQWIWKTDIRNLLNYLKLRMDSHAQYEIRVYANQIAKWVEGWLPNVWQAFCSYSLEAHTFSKEEMEILREFVGGNTNDIALNRPSSMTKREWRDFMKAIGIDDEGEIELTGRILDENKE